MATPKHLHAFREALTYMENCMVKLGNKHVEGKRLVFDPPIDLEEQCKCGITLARAVRQAAGK